VTAGSGAAEAGSYHVDRYPSEEQCGGVQVPQIVQSGTRQWPSRGSDLLYSLISLFISALTVSG
jgi:hypothetical protein